ncbi:MAG: DNA-3-methyladenine glycosylase [Bacteroidetes bacterium]|nr:DNA-3-methyladenine glycosylase [Bacteroidota bacterium]
MPKLDKTFYIKDDVVGIARALLGKVLYTNIEDRLTAGIIVETEAYHENEKACHAYNGRRTKRTAMLFVKGGKAYVYLCYGIHHLFNVVTGPEDVGQAVLIRGVMPYEGIEVMMERRKMDRVQPNLSSGPGTLSKALGITTNFNATDLQSDLIWIEDKDIYIPSSDIVSTPRIGVNYAGKDALLPWRFLIDADQIQLP